MKQQKIEIPSKVKAEGKSAERNLPAEILNILDQGIMMWSAEGTFMLFNTRGALDGMCNWNTVDLHDSISADSCWALCRGVAMNTNRAGSVLNTSTWPPIGTRFRCRSTSVLRSSAMEIPRPNSYTVRPYRDRVCTYQKVGQIRHPLRRTHFDGHCQRQAAGRAARKISP